ncbi:hypothetical protein LR69_01016 [Geobacillus sp. BCO2]|nr:hypothetical protein LR69_01016 [Geobacillus sp. BCO2]
MDNGGDKRPPRRHAGNWLKEQAALFGGKGGGNERQGQAAFPSREALSQFLFRVEAAGID